MLRPGRLYVIDRGYLDHELYRQIIEADSSFIGRIKDNGSYTTESQCPLTAADRAAGIASDERLKRLGTPHHKNELRGHQLRLVKVQRTNDEGELETWWLLTNKLDLPAELVALGYRYRWTVELFFRWLKCVLGCKQLLTTSENGVALQIYTALIASLLIVLWTGRKPTKRTWEMLQFYFQGWASLDEVQAHLEKQKLIALKSQETDGSSEEDLIDCHLRRDTERFAVEPVMVFCAARSHNNSWLPHGGHGSDVAGVTRLAVLLAHPFAAQIGSTRAQ